MKYAWEVILPFRYELITPQTEFIKADDLQSSLLLAELIQDAEAKREVLLKIDAVQGISKVDRNTRRSRITYWAKQLGKSPKTINHWYRIFQQEGWSTTVPAVHFDKAKLWGSKGWKPSTEHTDQLTFNSGQLLRI